MRSWPPDQPTHSKQVLENTTCFPIHFVLSWSLSAVVFGQKSDSASGANANRWHLKSANLGAAQRICVPFIRCNCLILPWENLAVRELSESLGAA